MASRPHTCITLDSSDDENEKGSRPWLPSRGPTGRYAKIKATKAKMWIEGTTSEESEEDKMPLLRKQAPRRKRGHVKNLLPLLIPPIKKRGIRALTEIRKGKIRAFNDLNCGDGEGYKFGVIGSRSWISELIKFLKEPRNHAVVPTDVCHWLKSSTEFFREERERSQSQLKSSPLNSCDSQESRASSSTGSDSGIPLDHEMDTDDRFPEGEDLGYEDIIPPTTTGPLPPVTLKYEDGNFGEPEADDSMEVAVIPAAKPGCSTTFSYMYEDTQQPYSPEPEYLFVRPKVRERPAPPSAAEVIPMDENVISAPAATPEPANAIPETEASYTVRTDLEEIPANTKNLLMNINCFGDMNAVLAYLTDTDQITPNLETLQTLTSVMIKLTDKARAHESCQGVNLNACSLALQSARAILGNLP